MRRRIIAIFTLFLLTAVAMIVARQSAAAALAQARAKKGAGDLQGAIQGFKRIATERSDDRNAAANALLELGGLYEFLGQDAEANDWYERVIEGYADQRAEKAAAAGHLAEMASRRKPGPPLKIKTPFTEDPFSFALSPDGRTLVIQATAADGTSRLWRQPVDPSKTPEPIPGTDGAGVNALPFFSPDGRSIGYFAKGKLWTIDARGGTPKEIAAAPIPGGGAWNRNGVLVFTGRGPRGPIESVKDGRLGTVPAPPGYYVFPVFMNDARFLYFKRDNRGYGKLEIGSLTEETPLAARGLPDAQFGTFPSGHLLYLVNRRLMALKFDPQDAAPNGLAFVLAERVGREARFPGNATLSASSAGPIAYREEATAARQFRWIDREGVQTGTLGTPDQVAGRRAHLSRWPHGGFLSQTGSPIGAVWAMDTATGATRVLRENSYRVVFSPDGRHTAFATLENGDRVIFYSDAGTGEIHRTPQGRSRGLVPEWSALVFARRGGGRSAGLFPEQCRTRCRRRNGRGRTQRTVFARRQLDRLSIRRKRTERGLCPTLPRLDRVQTTCLAEWRNHAAMGTRRKELYFLSPDNRVMNVSVFFSNDNQAIEFGTPSRLFQKPLRQGSEFEVAADGERFLVIEPVEDSPPIYVLSNWVPKK